MRRSIFVCLLMITAFFLGGILFPRAATAATYYIATTGSDSNPCTLAQPCLTFPYGVSKLTGGGDILYLRGGTYGTGIAFDSSTMASGTSWSNYITIAPYSGESVTLDGVGIYTHATTNGSPQYVLFKDFIMTGGQGCVSVINNPDGLNHPADSYLRFQNIDCHDFVGPTPEGAMGFFIFANHVEVIGGTVHDGPYGDSGPNPCGYVGRDCHGFYWQGAYGLVDGVEIYNHSGLGLQFYNGYFSADAHDNTIRNSRVHNNGILPSCCTGGIELGSGSNNLAYNNLVYNNPLSNGIIIGDSPNSYVYNNTTYGNFGVGIVIGTINGTTVKNNIAYDSIVDNGTGTVFATNLCPNAGTGCTVVGDPLFVNAGVANFHLQNGSPAINAGTTISAVPTDFDGIIRPQGAAYDIGAYEFQSGGGNPLVAWYQFNAGAGTTAFDSSGLGHTGTLSGATIPTWTPGKEGTALSFDGVSGSVDIANAGDLQLAGAFTLAAYVNPSAAQVDFRAVVAKNYTYFLYATSTGYCGNGGILAGFIQGVARTVCYATPLPINAWTHIAVTYNGSTLILYVNGGVVDSISVSGALDTDTGSLQIGATQYGENFAGKLDDIRIYNTALTATEVAALVIPPAPATHVAFTTQPMNAVAGVSLSPSVVIQLQDDTNTNVATSGVAITVALHVGNTGTLSGTLSQNTNGSGAATFANLSINLIGAKSLDASASTYTGATSSSFVISAAAANKLAFVQQPSNAAFTVAIAPPITVQIQDQFGNLTASTASVDMAIGTNPGGGSLSGTHPQSGVSGVATFGNLSINQPGIGYTLAASSSGLTGATSGVFTISGSAQAVMQVPARRTGLFAIP